MFGLLKKIFKKSNMAKKFDINVIDIDLDGKRITSVENGVLANNAEELKSIYGSCGQQIEIIREYQDEESNNYGKSNVINQNINNVDKSMLLDIPKNDMENYLKFVNGKENHKPNNTEEQKNNIKCQKQNYTLNNYDGPKFFTVGGMKCKIENNKIYQKQWMRLTDEEMVEYRIVSDKNNKIYPLKDKHIEMMKWVLTEESENKNNDSNLELING